MKLQKQILPTAQAIADYLERVTASFESKQFLRITLGRALRNADLIKIVFRPITLKSGNKISGTYTYTRRDETHNFTESELINTLKTLLQTSFLSATLFTANEDFSLLIREQESEITCKPPSLTPEISTSHNREKNYLVSADNSYLVALGISSATGKVKPDRYDKFRQINKFVEILSGLTRDIKQESVRLIDFGSGKHYLTFAAHSFLKESLKLPVQTTGVESREDLVATGSSVAKLLNLSDISFHQGSITQYNHANADIVMALHACDTATDDAIIQAIRMNAQVVALTPCCHKYLRKNFHCAEELAAIFRHGILEERLAESLTDGLRALVLESFGYEVKVFEFISLEHTAKNVMITAQKKSSISHAKKQKALDEIKRLKEYFSLTDFYLDKQLAIAV